MKERIGFFTLILSSCCRIAISVLYLFPMLSWFSLQCVILAFPGHTYLLFVVTFTEIHVFRQRSGSVVECLTRDRGAAGSSLTGVTA